MSSGTCTARRALSVPAGRAPLRRVGAPDGDYVRGRCDICGPRGTRGPADVRHRSAVADPLALAAIAGVAAILRRDRARMQEQLQALSLEALARAGDSLALRVEEARRADREQAEQARVADRERVEDDAAPTVSAPPARWPRAARRYAA